MLRRFTVVGAIAVALLATTTPTFADDYVDVPEVPVYVPLHVGGGDVLPPDPGSSDPTKTCTTKSRMSTNPPQPQSSRICVYRDVDKVWGSVDFSAAAWGIDQDVYVDVKTYRCRVSDNYCAVIASDYQHLTTDPYGYAYLETAKTSQTLDQRYYKTCASMSTSVGFGYGRTCTQPQA
jgi:hypothetical protein